MPLLLVAGQEDAKFVAAHRQLLAALNSQVPAPSIQGAAVLGAPAANGGSAPAASSGEAQAAAQHQLLELPGCGHAVHEEAPLQLMMHLRVFLLQTVLGDAL